MGTARPSANTGTTMLFGNIFSYWQLWFRVYRLSIFRWTRPDDFFFSRPSWSRRVSTELAWTTAGALLIIMARLSKVLHSCVRGFRKTSAAVVVVHPTSPTVTGNGLCYASTRRRHFSRDAVNELRPIRLGGHPFWRSARGRCICRANGVLGQLHCPSPVVNVKGIPLRGPVFRGPLVPGTPSSRNPTGSSFARGRTWIGIVRIVRGNRFACMGVPPWT